MISDDGFSALWPGFLFLLYIDNVAHLLSAMWLQYPCYCTSQNKSKWTDVITTIIVPHGMKSKWMVKLNQNGYHNHCYWTSWNQMKMDSLNNYCYCTSWNQIKMNSFALTELHEIKSKSTAEITSVIVHHQIKSKSMVVTPSVILSLV